MTCTRDTLRPTTFVEAALDHPTPSEASGDGPDDASNRHRDRADDHSDVSGDRGIGSRVPETCRSHRPVRRQHRKGRIAGRWSSESRRTDRPFVGKAAWAAPLSRGNASRQVDYATAHGQHSRRVTRRVLYWIGRAGRVSGPACCQSDAVVDGLHE